jgi:hypothetical protein
MIGLAIALPSTSLTSTWGDYEDVAEILSVDGRGPWHGSRLIVCCSSTPASEVVLPPGHIYLPALPMRSRLRFTLVADEFRAAHLERPACTLADFQTDNPPQLALPARPLVSKTTCAPLTDWFSWAGFGSEWVFAQPRLHQPAPLPGTQAS